VKIYDLLREKISAPHSGVSSFISFSELKQYQDELCCNCKIKKKGAFQLKKTAIFALTKAGSQWQVEKVVRLRPRLI
jgi:hypothetical protein